MVSKCANPGCSAPFLYLRQGKLFCMETSSSAEQGPTFGADPTIERRARRLEFFWLCDDCAAAMTLDFTPGRGVKVHPRERALAVATAL